MLRVFETSTRASAPPPLFVASLLHRCLVAATAAHSPDVATSPSPAIVALQDILLSVQNPEDCLAALCYQWRLERNRASAGEDPLHIQEIVPGGVNSVVRQLYPSIMSLLAGRAHDAFLQVLLELIAHSGSHCGDEAEMQVFREATQRAHASKGSLSALFGPLTRLARTPNLIVEVANLVDAMREASHTVYIDLDDVMTLMSSASSCGNFEQTILQWWSWLQYTRAAVDPRVLSVVMEIQCDSCQHRDAPETHHKILSQGVAPSLRAQAAYLKLLSRRSTLSIAYAEHIVARWKALTGGSASKTEGTSEYKVQIEMIRLYHKDITSRGRTDSQKKMMQLIDGLVDPMSPSSSHLGPAFLTFVLRTMLAEVYFQRRDVADGSIVGSGSSDATANQELQVERVIVNALHAALKHHAPSEVGGEGLAAQMILAADAVDMLEVVGEWLQRELSDESFEKILRDVMGRSDRHFAALTGEVVEGATAVLGDAVVDGGKRQDHGKRRELLLQAVCETANREMPQTLIAWLQLLDEGQQTHDGELDTHSP